MGNYSPSCPERVFIFYYFFKILLGFMIINKLKAETVFSLGHVIKNSL